MIFDCFSRFISRISLLSHTSALLPVLLINHMTHPHVKSETPCCAGAGAAIAAAAVCVGVVGRGSAYATTFFSYL